MTRPDAHSNRPTIDGRMLRIRLEVADILRRHGDAYRRVHAGHLGRVERLVMSAIVACRTEALGGHIEACDDCGMTRIAYNSCRNRHCPKCQGKARAEWLAAREADLLPLASTGASTAPKLIDAMSHDAAVLKQKAAHNAKRVTF